MSKLEENERVNACEFGYLLNNQTQIDKKVRRLFNVKFTYHSKIRGTPVGLSQQLFYAKKVAKAVMKRAESKKTIKFCCYDFERDGLVVLLLAN